MKLRTRIRRNLPVFDPIKTTDRAIYVTGGARSGTTWISEMLCASLRARLVFEPLHHNGSVPTAPHFSGLSNNDPVLQTGIERAISGALNDKKVNLWQRPGIYFRRVIKDIRPGLLSVVREVVPDVPVVFIIRHPIEIAVSCAELELRDGDWWGADAAMDELRSHTQSSNKRLSELAELCVGAYEACPTELTKYVGIWCVGNALALDLFPMQDAVLFRYEDLLLSPELHFPAMETLCGVKLKWQELKAKPSKTTFRDPKGIGKLGKWRRTVDVDEAAALLQITEQFGLSFLYGTDPESESLPALPTKYRNR